MGLGPEISGFADDLETMLRMIGRSHAFLMSMADFQILDDSEEARGVEEDPWPKQVRQAVVARAPRLSGWFARRVRLVAQGEGTKFDFLGQCIAAQLGRLIPGSTMGEQVRRAKAKLFDLETLRDSPDVYMLERPRDYELLLYRPRDDDPAYSPSSIERLHEALAGLEEAGDRQELRVRPVFDADKAAERIVEAEAA
jgi:hypothetical protein